MRSGPSRPGEGNRRGRATTRDCPYYGRIGARGSCRGGSRGRATRRDRATTRDCPYYGRIGLSRGFVVMHYMFRLPTESLVVLCTRGRKGDCLVGVMGVGYRWGRAAIKAPTPHPLLSRPYAKSYSKPVREAERTDIWQEMSWC